MGLSSSDERSPLLNASDSYSESISEYRLYTRRWYMLAVVFMLNIGNAMVWLSFANVPDKTATYYSKSEAYVNWLSIVFLLASLVFGLLAVWILDFVGLRAGVLLGAILNAVGCGVRIASTVSSLGSDYRFTVVMVGQALCAFAQVFVLVSPTKLAALWFAASERAEANMVATMSRFPMFNLYGGEGPVTMAALTVVLGCVPAILILFQENVHNYMMSYLGNPLGVMLASILAPYIVKDDKDIPKMLVYFSIPSFLGCAMAVFGFCSSTPPTPPTSSAATDSEPFISGIKKALRNKAYVILMFSYGTGVGLFTALTTLLQQIICPQGYSDEVAGIANAVLIAVGLVGAGFVGWLLDKTKKFEEINKVCYGMAVVACSVLLIVVQRGGHSALVIMAAGLFGFFALALVPGCLEVGVECTFPVAEATTAGLQWMTGQATGIVLILVSQVLATKKHKSGTNTCKLNEDGTITDFKWAMYLMTATAAFTALVFIVFFKPTYQRLAEEQRMAAERILNSQDDSLQIPS